MMYLFGTIKGTYDRMLMPDGKLCGLYATVQYGFSHQPFEARELYRLSDVNPSHNGSLDRLNESIHNNKIRCKQTLEQTDINNIIRNIKER